MRTIAKSLFLATAAATPAYAAGGTTGAGSLLIIAFFGFAALIVAFQFVPALLLFGALLKGLFAAPKETPPVPKR